MLHLVASEHAAPGSITETSIGGLRPADSRHSSIGSAAVERVSPHQSHFAMLSQISASSQRLSDETSQRAVVDARAQVDRPSH